MYKLFRFTHAELQPLLDEVSVLESSTDFGSGLINHRIYLEQSKSYMDSFLAPHVAGFGKEFGWPEELKVFRAQKNLRLEDYWVNFMGPGACTPIHSHGGCISWCLWLRVPYMREDELTAAPFIPEGNNINGDFAFHWVTDRGIKTQPMRVDRTWEGTLMMWPAYLHHSVFPYYSTNELRVSVAGNYWFDV